MNILNCSVLFYSIHSHSTFFFCKASSPSARRKNPPSRGTWCALQQKCRRGSKPRQLPTTKHFENSSIIFITAHQKSETTRSCKFLSGLAPKSVARVFGSWRSTTTTTKNHHHHHHYCPHHHHYHRQYRPHHHHHIYSV